MATTPVTPLTPATPTVSTALPTPTTPARTTTTETKEGWGWAAYLIAAIIILLLVYFLWMWWKSAETVLVFRTDPVTDALLRYHRRSDPIDSSLISREHMVHTRDEDPYLVSKLWR
ncbi:MAG: hypothetical protein QW303_01600 [Nitrososphaerota archaeon]